MKLTDHELLTTAKAATDLQRTPDWVRQLTRKGTLPSVCTRSGQRIFLAKDVVEFKRKRAQ